VTIAEYFVVLQRRWRVWGTGLLLGWLMAMVVIAVTPVAYTAVATSFVTVSDVSAGDSTAIFQGSQFTVQRMGSYVQLASSPAVLDPVISDLGLPDSSRQLAGRIAVSSPANSVLIKVAVTDADPEQAQRTANAVSSHLGDLIEGLETPRGSKTSSVKVTLTQPAAKPLAPSSPNKPLDLALGLIAGGALGVAAALLRHHLDRRLKTPDAVRSIVGMSPLGSTLHTRKARRQPLTAVDVTSIDADRYRGIRSSFRFASVDDDVDQFVVTSAMPGEGKSTVAANLAISWAQAGSTVCLVEADLRRPAIANFFGLDGNIGLSDVLVSDVDLEDVLVRWENPNLTVLPAGSVPPDSTALLGSAAMADLVRTLGARYDVVIFDSPPLLSVADAAVLSHTVGGLVLVVRYGRTSGEQLASAVRAIREARLNLLGTVLSAVKISGRKAQGSFYSARPNSGARLDRVSPGDSSSFEGQPAASAPRDEPERSARAAETEKPSGVVETAEDDEIAGTVETAEDDEIAGTDETAEPERNGVTSSRPGFDRQGFDEGERRVYGKVPVKRR
jgi:capsular exopolysaccharide synthesis family protein